MSWQQVVLSNFKSSSVEALEELLESSALSVTYMDSNDNAIFETFLNEFSLWKLVDVTLLFALETDLAPIIQSIKDHFSLEDLTYTVTILEDREWEKEYLKDFKPLKFANRLAIYPTNFPLEEEDADKLIIYLDPGLAFGTGSHETTALCLEFLANTKLTNKSLLDFGCGSGILGIAGAKLGAKEVAGLDIDERALEASHNNAVFNGVDNFALYLADNELTLNKQFDYVVANVLARPLIELNDYVVSFVKQGGTLALSGILVEQAPEVIEAYTKHCTLQKQINKNEWCILIFQN